MEHGTVGPINKDFSTMKLTKKQIIDVIELLIGQDKLVLSESMDLYNNRIVGYQLSETQDVQFVEDMLLKTQEILQNSLSIPAGEDPIA